MEVSLQVRRLRLPHGTLAQRACTTIPALHWRRPGLPPVVIDDARHSRGEHALLFIESVGKPIRPALRDLSQAAEVVVLSVTEGEDKPPKHPDRFAATTPMLIDMIDLLPSVDVDAPRCIACAGRSNPGIDVLLASATRRDGMNAWLGRTLAPDTDHPQPWSVQPLSRISEGLQP